MTGDGVFNDLLNLPHDLPVPQDDGGCDHLPGLTLPGISLPATDGRSIDLSSFEGFCVVFAYPRTGRPNQRPLVDYWNQIPGARGCTPQCISFRDLYPEFQSRCLQVFGLSTQSTMYQTELVERLKIPFPVLSDEHLQFKTALNLPAFEVAGQVLIKRMALFMTDGIIRKVFYPVFPSDQNASAVLKWFDANETELTTFKKLYP